MNYLECGSKEIHRGKPLFMCLPGTVLVPSQYYLCKEHKDLRFNFEDIYNEDGS